MSEPSEHLEHLDEGRRLTDKVDELIQQGKPAQARAVLARGWEEVVPGLPLRYPVALENFSSRVARRLARSLKEDQIAGHVGRPELSLSLSGSRVPKAVVRLGDERLGDLPAEQARFLYELGTNATLYRPHLTAIRASDEGGIAAVEIELVRPEMTGCPKCGQAHDPAQVCASSSDDEAEEPEAPTAGLQEAIDVIAVEEHRSRFSVKGMLDQIEKGKKKSGR
jgi:hypothetical protein